MFAMRRSSENPSSVTSQNSITTGSTPDDLVAAIEQLIRHRLHSNVHIDGPISEALFRLVALVQQANTRQLVLVTNLRR